MKSILRKAILRYLLFTFFTALSLFTLSCNNEEEEENEIVPAPEMDFEATESATSTTLNVFYRNTSQYADPDSYAWTIEYIGVEFPDQITPQLIFESNEEDIEYDYITRGYYRVTLSGSNSNGFGSTSQLTRFE